MALREIGEPQALVQPLATPVVASPVDSGVLPVLKRGMDLICASLLILFFAVPMIVIAIGVRVSSPGPVFFRQLRVGRRGRLFYSLKFRSMYVDAEDRQAEVAHLNEKDGPIFKIRKDPRITPVGRLLRKTSLDELPQLFNVIRGDMSLVGPRPALMREVLSYEPWQLLRLSVRPGLTGLWQVSGRSELPFETMMRLDMEYVRTMSIWTDVRLLLRTIPAVISGRGAY